MNERTAEAIQDNKRRVSLWRGVCPTCGGDVKRMMGILDLLGFYPIRLKCSNCGVHKMDLEY